MSTDLSPASPAPSPPVAEGTGAPVANPAGAAGLLPVPNELWRTLYTITAALPERGGAQWWSAQRKDTAEAVFLCARPETKNDPRSTVWGHLRKIELSHLQRVQEEFVVGPYRVEVYAAVQGTPLDVWRQKREAPELATVEALVRQLTEAIGVLHASGLVHLGISPEAIFIQENKGQLHCTLGGLESVALIEHAQPLLFRPDPFYAPPEVVMLETHAPSPALCAWDWWSLGRVVQEFILGHPVLDDLPGANPAETKPERVERAEALLLELAPGGPRAGAVESMPPQDERVTLLLRGLLASAPEARWGMEAMDSWGRQLPVKDNYDKRRTETKFRWRGRRYSIPDAARALQAAEHREAAIVNIFDAATAGTLREFIGKTPDDKNYRAQLTELVALVEVEPLKALPEPLAREVVACLALLMLAGQNVLWRGQRLGGESLPALLAEAPDDPDQLALVRALSHRTVTAKIERFDHAASRSLSQVGRLAEDSEALIRRNGWVKGIDPAASERIFRLAITAEADLLALRAGLQSRFACTTHASLERSFHAARPTRVDLVLVAWAEPAPADHGFITHEEWQARQLGVLRERSAPLVAGLFWAQQGRALEAGPAVFGHWPAVLALWGGIAAVLALLSPGPEWLPAALAPGVLALGIRMLFAKITASALRRFVAQGRPWRWADTSERCRTEMAALTQGLDRAGLVGALDAVDAEIGKLNLLVPVPAPTTRPPGFAGQRLAAHASWVLLAGAVFCAGWRGYVAPPTLPQLQAAWIPAALLPSEDAGDDAKDSAPAPRLSQPPAATVKASVTPTPAAVGAPAAQVARVSPGAAAGAKVAAPAAPVAPGTSVATATSAAKGGGTTALSATPVAKTTAGSASVSTSALPTSPAVKAAGVTVGSAGAKVGPSAAVGAKVAVPAVPTTSVPAARPTAAAVTGLGVATATSAPGAVSEGGSRGKAVWPFPPTPNFKRVVALRAMEASPPQLAYALRRGRAIVAPYQAATTQLKVIFEVPVAEKTGVMIYDGARDALVGNNVFILEKYPPQQTWIELDQHKGFVVAE